MSTEEDDLTSPVELNNEALPEEEPMANGTSGPKDEPKEEPKEKPKEEVNKDEALKHNGNTDNGKSSIDVPPDLPSTPVVEIDHIPPVSTNGTLTPDRRRDSMFLATAANATVDNTHIFKKTFEGILESKGTKKNDQLKLSIEQALASLQDETSNGDPHVIFNALKVICEQTKGESQAKAIDLFAKLFDYAKFDDPKQKVNMTEMAIDVIAKCFEFQATEPEIELQIVRALMHSILLMPCHGEKLLQAIRIIYNVFIFSLSPRNQALAQGTLTQVVDAIYLRVHDKVLKNRKLRSGSYIFTKTGTNNSTSEVNNNLNNDDLETSSVAEQQITISKLEQFNDADDANSPDVNPENASEEELLIQDAFLVFRSMCKLSSKVLETETLDMRSHSVRSKLLSLHFMHTILKNHIEIFISHDVTLKTASGAGSTRLIDSVKPYLLSSLIKNAASPLAPVFESSLEIFWLIISNLRPDFKREIPVFWDEIYFPVAEMKTSTPHQKRYLLSIIERLCNDSRCIIEFYLNYDCNAGMSNICEQILDYLTRLSLTRVEVTPLQKANFRENRRKGISVYDISKSSNLVSSTMSSKPPEPEIYHLFPLEYAMKMTSISCIVGFLRSIHSWAQKGVRTSSSTPLARNSSHNSLNRSRSAQFDSSTSILEARNSISESTTEIDNPEQFESLKQRKKALLDGIKRFNQKPKKGVPFLIENGFIKSDAPIDIAKFLLETDGLDKATIGDYLGEGDAANIAIMHAFVDEMDFNNTAFVDALRMFLQSFRLPGEAQKIDRFMMKFAERYVSGNPNVFANADAGYVLAYSVVMLNTDLHSPQIKNRMTFDSFVRNNSKINDGEDLDLDFLRGIYDEIGSNEIKLQSEQHAALISGDLNMNNNGSLSFFGGRDVNLEAYLHASKEMSSKTEKLLNLGKKGRIQSTLDTTYYVASNILHVKSIFDTMWMSVLAGLTPPFKEYDEEDVTKLCLEGIKLSIRISCMFDIDDARVAFIGALVQFQNLNNYAEMKPKNVEAIYIMLEIAIADGNYLNSETWAQILISISQLSRLQLIAQGIDQGQIPDVNTARLVNRDSLESTTTSTTTTSSYFLFSPGTPSQSQVASNKFHNQHLSPEVADLITKTEFEVAIDRIYSNSANLSGDSILEFVTALSKVAADEIESSGQSKNPRMFSLQKTVDVCYYNMTRVRFEWAHLWSILGTSFTNAGCHLNEAIAIFALDSLKQMSDRFLEIDELAHFKFQREFLKPFGYVMGHSASLDVKDWVLECINVTILSKAKLIKSGWKTIFEVLSTAANENKESLVKKSFKVAEEINKNYIDIVRSQDSFAELVTCFTSLAKNERFQKISLSSLEVLGRLIKQIAIIHFGEHDFNKGPLKLSLEENNAENFKNLWFPLLLGFHDIIMTGQELEVRSRALNFLFNILTTYGEYFDLEFWEQINKEILFPTFVILNEYWEVSVDTTNDNLSVWLSTTLIQALKGVVDLFTHYFSKLNGMLEGYLDLIIRCICQENDTIAKIGRECLCTLLIDNAEKFTDDHWVIIYDAFSTLFELTTAKELFMSVDHDEQASISTDSEKGDVGNNMEPNPSQLSINTYENAESRIQKSREKLSIVVKSVLQLLLIQALSELFQNDSFYESVPYDTLIKVSDLLHRSYDFANKFNDNYDLRYKLWNEGVIERLPNLLKQESSASAVYINIMFRAYCDDDKADEAGKTTILDKTLPICLNIVERYVNFDEGSHQRNISTWKPVVIEILQGYVELDEGHFKTYAKSVYILAVQLLGRTLSPDLRNAVKNFFARVGEEFLGLEINSSLL
ncbi:guanine nucleotide exchange protein for ADP-robosylation factor [Scheffersomyces spartinae]|uniref:Guanine nucleotide exchange protein for ADP-robosylation factor n=1 Tax=Scheffersomyces spartinae TaxID=45513 RepID=A0A9P7V6G8_9ASCO|nr:guanine nucleotide exchange protein for ADP-robosylation factor [Scheffersomyces spartinae]KAG7192263.1 guanine nucleotide exchange protein for ADP-robosylation factor [Scheffersomyces spartinae]